MAFFKSLSVISISLLITLLFITSIRAATIDITKNCDNTVWHGPQLFPATANPSTKAKLGPSIFHQHAQLEPARVWTGIGNNFDWVGRGTCQTGDCGWVLECSAFGQPPNTLVEYALNQFSNLDFFDISLVDGFNVPMEFSPTSAGCTRNIRCTADINEEFPSELRAPGGCNNPCTIFKTDEYYCYSGSCGPTPLSRFFKERYPDAYSNLRMIKLAHLLVPGEPTTRLCFALEILLEDVLQYASIVASIQ